MDDPLPEYQGVEDGPRRLGVHPHREGIHDLTWLMGAKGVPPRGA